MWWKLLSVVSVVALVMINSGPAAAADGDRFGGPQFNFSDQYRGSAEIKPGVYFQIPLSGNLRRSVADSRVGLMLSARLPGQYRASAGVDRYNGRVVPRFTASRLELSIGLAGKDTVRLNGMRLTDMGGLRADGDAEERVWPWFLGGAVGMIGLLAILSTTD